MLRILAILAIGCTLSTACSTEEHSEIGSEELVDQKQQILLTLRLQTSPGGAASRSFTGDDGNAYDDPNDKTPGTEEGTEDENTISDALIVLGKISPGSFHPTRVHSVHYLNNFVQQPGASVWSGIIEELPAKYRIVVIANPLPIVKDNIEKIRGAKWESFLKEKITLDAAPDYFPQMSQGKTTEQYIWSHGKFMMTNYFDSKIEEHEIDLLPGKGEKNISVQRLCARFDYITHPEHADNTYQLEITGGDAQKTVSKITLKLEDVGLTNLSRSFYLMKMFAKDKNLESSMEITPHAKETSDNYVADTDWKEKKNFAVLPTERLKEMFFYGSENGLQQGTTAPIMKYRTLPTNQTAYEKLFYATENTVPGISRQVNRLSTGIVFKGHFTVEGTQADIVYYYKDLSGTYHITDRWEHVNQTLYGGKQPDCPTDEALADKGIRKFVKDKATGKFPVWYTYWNRHNDNSNPNQMGIMEFAVVRNNVYKLMVNSISTLGLPKDPTDPENPWKPDGNTPDEEWPDLDIQFQVKSWNERHYDYEI